ncbi:MAG: hypothetical protein M5U26_29375 [Planctomycetota bacterium]|nr:hypothetical protein [Planctomycetota bacterium]
MPALDERAGRALRLVQGFTRLVHALHLAKHARGPQQGDPDLFEAEAARGEAHAPWIELGEALAASPTEAFVD